MPTVELPTLVPLAVSMMVFFVLTSVIAQKRKTKVKQAFSYFMGTVFALTVLEFIVKLPIDVPIRVGLFYGGYILVTSLGILHLYFMYTVTETRLNTPFKVLSIIAIACILMILLPGVDRIHYDDVGRPIIMLTPTLAIGVAVGAVIPGIFSLILCIQHLRRSQNEREHRIMTLLLQGTALAMVVSVGILLGIPFVAPGRSDIYQFSSLGVLIHAVYLSKAVSRYHFLSVNYDEIEQVSRSLFEHVPEAVIIFGAAGEVVQTNGPAKAMFAGSITRASISRAVPGYQFEKGYERWHTSIVTNDSPRHILITQSDIGPADSPIGRLLLIRDIDDEVRLQEERSEIERKALQSEKLEAIGQLAGGVAHDFNNQLAGITGYADLLRDDLRNHPRRAKFVDGILLCAKRAADVTAQLLAFARKGRYLSVSIDLNDTILEVVAMMTHSVDKRIRLTTRLDAPFAEILGDPSQIQNAILNLGLNARDAMEQGGEITFRTGIAEIDDVTRGALNLDLDIGTYAVVAVEDTGVGMTRAIRRRIFEPFFTTKPEGKGTGMGLAAVYGTVRNHGGAITVTTTPDEGSAFQVYLPLRNRNHDPRTGRDSSPPQIPGHGQSILLVDDEPVILETSSTMLRQLGYNVLEATSGQEAVERFESIGREIDLVILDLVMPEMNGESVFEQVRTIYPDAKVLISSGYSIDKTAHRLIAAGANGFIQKPFRKAELSRQVAALIASNGQTKA